MRLKTPTSRLWEGIRRCPRNALPFLALFALALSGCATGMNVTEKVMWSTYPLATDQGMATGFVVTRRDSTAPGGVLPIVLTSVHVLDTVGKGPLSMAIRIPDEQGEVQVVVLQFHTTPGAPRFYARHPQHDIGAFAIRVPPEAAGLIPLPSFLDEKSLPKGNAMPRPGVDVSFVGFPDVAPGTVGAFPVLRNGKVASYPIGEMRTQRKFLVNADVYPGDSGAPVFSEGRGGRPQLVGMVSQRIGTDPKAFAHFAIAVDAAAIRETIDLLMEQEARMTAEEVAARQKVERPAPARVPKRRALKRE